MMVFLVPILLAGPTLSCREAQVRSIWRQWEIAVDGSRADWQGIDVYSFDDKQILLGITNDEESLYLLLVTSNRMLGMHALREGLTASFGLEGAKAANLSVGYARRPAMGPGDGGDPPAEGEKGEERRAPPGDPGSGMRRPNGDGEQMIRRALDSPPEQILIVSPDAGDTVRLSLEEAARRGIEERAGYKDGYFVLELKVPLKKDSAHPQAVGVSSVAPDQAGKGDVVELNLRIPKTKGMSMPSGGFRPHGGGSRFSQEGGGEDPDDSGFPGRGGRGERDGSGPGERPQSSSGRMVNGLDLKLRILLSERPSAGS
jgi:hypothetical protein